MNRGTSIREDLARLDFLTGGGSMGDRMRAHDWSDSPLGRPGDWSAALKSTVAMMLPADAQIVLFWGPELVALYNDAYAPTIGDKHPRALGRPARENWTELWDDLEPLLRKVLDRGETVSAKDRPFYIERHGFPETVYFDISYSPVRGESGAVEGVLCLVNETTERVLALLSLRESEEQLRLVVDGATDYAIFTIDPQRRVTSWSKGAEQAFGYSAEQIMGECADLLWVPEDLENRQPEREVETAAATGCANNERWHQRKDGSRVFMNGSVHPLPRDLAGKERGFIKMARDETDRRKAEDALRESEQRYRTLFEAIDAGFCIVEVEFDAGGKAADYQFVEVNPAFERQTGLVDAIGKSARELVPDLEDHWFETYGEVARSGQSKRFEDGSVPMGRWFDVYAFPSGRSGENRVAILFTDISDRRKMEQSLRESETRFRNMADNAPVMMWVTEADGSASYLNKRWYEFTGQTEEEALGFGWLEAAHPDDMAEAERAFLEANAKQEAFRIEYRLRRHDGTYRWAIDAASPRFDPGGEFRGYIGSVIDIHDRKEAEEALRESEEFNRRILNSSGDCIKVLSLDARLESMSPGGQLVMEVDDFDAMKGRYWPDAWPGEGHAKALAAVETARAGRESRFQGFCPTAKGTPKWWDVSVTPILGSDGKPEKLLSISRDISQIKAADQALRESEHRFRGVFENAGVGMIELNADWQILGVNAAFAKIAGRSEDDLVGADSLSFTHPDDLARSQEAMRGIVGGQIDRANVEKRYVRPDGEMVWVRSNITRVPTEGGDRFLKIVEDISDRKAAEAALRERSEEFYALADNMSQFAWMADADGWIYWYNQRWYDYTGTTLDEMQGWGWKAVHHPDHLERVVESIQRSWDTGEPWEDTFPLRGKDGRYRWFLSRARPIRDETGKLLRWFGTNTDITAQLQAENALRELNETLEERVQDRTRELETASEALRQSQKMEAIGQLTGGIAHDFNNMLTVIRGSADMLRRPDLSEAKRTRYLAGIADTADRAAKLTGQLLAFARRQALKPETFEALDRVDSIAEMLRTVLGSRIALTISADCDHCFVQADASQFETALVNMAVNARDAMDGQGELSIRVGRSGGMPGSPQLRDERDYVAVSVADTGSGISPEDKEKIFEPFFTTKEVGKGTGLGLSQVYGFAKQSGGEIGVESEVGKGTTFTLYLPRAEEGREPSEQPEQLPELRSGGKVLVVEDNEQVGEFAEHVLAELGFEAQLATSADEALRLLDAGDAFDVVFSDVVMPGISGIDLAHEIRQRRPELPVVLTSGYSHVLAAQSGHGFPLLQKPYSLEGLQRALGEALRR